MIAENDVRLCNLSKTGYFKENYYNNQDNIYE